VRPGGYLDIILRDKADNVSEVVSVYVRADFLSWRVSTARPTDDRPGGVAYVRVCMSFT